MTKGATGRGVPVEEFVQTLTGQLDRAQDTLALKVRTGRPLTWALKDLSLELPVFVEVDATSGKVLMRSAAPNEEGASTVHLNIAAITRPMVEENTLADDADPRSIDDLRAAAQFDPEDQRKLDMMGVRTIGQLKRLGAAGRQQVEAMIGIPALRLRAALEAASRPAVTGQEIVRRGDGTQLLRIHGANLHDGITPEVRLAGEPVEVLESSPQQLLVRPLAHHGEGQVEVLVAGQRATG